MNKFTENSIYQFLFLGCLVLLSRLPFLWAGFGAEEDSWLLALTAKNMALSGMYEMSRAPGHPLLELIYANLYNKGLYAFHTNLISAVSSVIAVLFFSGALKTIGFKHYLFAGAAFAFTPIVFISSTYTIDYMPAMALVMMSFYFISLVVLQKGEDSSTAMLFAGIALGLAIGIRLTSGAMLIPFLIMIIQFKYFKRNFIILTTVTLLTAMIAYVPVLLTYGLSFFHYSDQFPYPNIFKLTYKASLGVFGLIGLLAIGLFKISLLKSGFDDKSKRITSGMSKTLLAASLSVFVLYFISYLRLPQKSAYLIPIVPFSILLMGYYLNSIRFQIFCVLMTVSSFLFSINLTDPLRGSDYSAASFTFHLGGQEMFIDPITGPVFSDYSKRHNKIKYVNELFERTQSEKRKILLISGWWYNQLLVRRWGSNVNENVKPVFYVSRQEMEEHVKMGYEIFYLPEQNLYNDLYSGIQYTDSVSKQY